MATLWTIRLLRAVAVGGACLWQEVMVAPHQGMLVGPILEDVHPLQEPMVVVRPRGELLHLALQRGRAAAEALVVARRRDGEETRAAERLLLGQQTEAALAMAVAAAAV